MAQRRRQTHKSDNDAVLQAQCQRFEDDGTHAQLLKSLQVEVHDALYEKGHITPYVTIDADDTGDDDDDHDDHDDNGAMNRGDDKDHKRLHTVSTKVVSTKRPRTKVDIADWVTKIDAVALDTHKNDLSTYLFVRTNLLQCIRLLGAQCVRIYHHTDKITEFVNLKELERKVALTRRTPPSGTAPSSTPSGTPSATPSRTPSGSRSTQKPRICVWDEENKKRQILIAFGSATQTGTSNAVATSMRCPLCGQITKFRPNDSGGGRADDGTRLKYTCSTPECRLYQFIA